MKSHFFAYISRMRFIQRWALMRNTAPENVQEHSHQVAVLAHALAVIRNEKFGGRLDPGAVAVAALYHDASEILTGDMPTPIKYDNPAIRNAYKDVEAVAEGKLLHMLPPELQGVYGPILTQSDPEVRQVVKAADKLSAYIKGCPERPQQTVPLLCTLLPEVVFDSNHDPATARISPGRTQPHIVASDNLCCNQILHHSRS